MTSLICALAIVLGVDAFDSEFQAANKAYDGKNYVEAVQGYERIIASGAHNAGVFYNLGNAYYQAGRLGPAIANYERALALQPAFRQSTENLNKALSETKNKLPKPLRAPWQQALLFWDASLTYRAALALAVVAWLGFWILLAARLITRVPYSRAIAVLLCSLAMLSGLSAWCKAHPVSLAVGADASAPVRYGTTDTDPVRFELAAGDRVAVEEQAAGWLRVRSVDGVRGWVREGQVCFVGPPYLPAPAAKAQGS